MAGLAKDSATAVQSSVRAQGHPQEDEDIEDMAENYMSRRAPGSIRPNGEEEMAALDVYSAVAKAFRDRKSKSKYFTKAGHASSDEDDDEEWTSDEDKPKPEKRSPPPSATRKEPAAKRAKQEKAVAASSSTRCRAQSPDETDGTFTIEKVFGHAIGGRVRELLEEYSAVDHSEMYVQANDENPVIILWRATSGTLIFAKRNAKIEFHDHHPLSFEVASGSVTVTATNSAGVVKNRGDLFVGAASITALCDETVVRYIEGGKDVRGNTLGGFATNIANWVAKLFSPGDGGH